MDTSNVNQGQLQLTTGSEAATDASNIDNGEMVNSCPLQNQNQMEQLQDKLQVATKINENVIKIIDEVWKKITKAEESLTALEQRLNVIENNAAEDDVLIELDNLYEDAWEGRRANQQLVGVTEAVAKISEAFHTVENTIQNAMESECVSKNDKEDQEHPTVSLMKRVEARLGQFEQRLLAAGNRLDDIDVL